MKHLFFAATAALALLCSCSKENDEIINSTKGSVVNVSFTEDAPETRAFFGTTAAAETWEKTLNSVVMYAFNPSGTLILQRSFSPAELTAKKASFALPNVTAGSSCDFYAVANFPAANVANKAALLAVLESSAAGYNGTFAEVSSGAKRTNGFVMSGSTSQAVAAEGSATNIAITLKRTVAKVSMETTVSPDFGTTYPGTVKVNNVVIHKAASQSPIIKPTTASTGTMNFAHTQAVNSTGSKFQNLFYLFENGSLAAGARVTATIHATYDADSNFSTTADQSDMTYNVELSGDAAGAISRNGYYRVNVSINGLSGSSATLTITVADWETPITQSVNVGS
ncbi:MAG: FimB/Mfa2 family fimbrial subunit [Alistipes sp.]